MPRSGYSANAPKAVGRLIVIDGDHVTISNLERLHGSRPSDVEAATPKALVAKRSVAEFAPHCEVRAVVGRSEEHTSELQSLMRISYAVFCLKKKNKHNVKTPKTQATQLLTHAIYWHHYIY